MLLFSKKAIGKLKEVLLLNAYTVEALGYARGKAGIALTLFELARYLDDDSLENHAFDLLQEVLAQELNNNDFPNGRAGIAYVLHHLINNRYLDADYLELYEEQHECIVKNIVLSQQEERNPYKYLYDLFFVSSLSTVISPKNYTECLDVLLTNIYKELDRLHEKVRLETGILFYDYASKLLSICCSTTLPDVVSDQILYRVERTSQKLLALDGVCTHFSFPLLVFICSKRQGKRDLSTKTVELIHETTKNVCVPALHFRQKTDLALNIYRLYGLNSELDFRNRADDMLRTVIDDDMAVLEQKLYNHIVRSSKNNTGIGIAAGVSRLVLMAVYWDEIRAGHPSKNVVGLFN